MQGENEYVRIYDTRDSIYPLSDVMKVFSHPDAKIQLTNGDYGYIECNTNGNDRIFEEKHYLAPIPTGQIALNPNLGQNPGW